MKFNKTTLKNGLRIITVPDQSNPAVTVMIMVEAGSKYETKAENGLSHFLEHMVFKGTATRPKASDISLELDSIGAHYNAFTSNEYTGYYAKVEPKHVSKAVDIISDMYLNPLLDQLEIDKECGVIVEEIKMYKDLPEREAAVALVSLIYGDQPAGWPVIGDVKTVKSFNRKHFVDYRTKNYVPSSTTVIVSGSFEEGKVIDQVKGYFDQVPPAPKPVKLAVIEKQSKPEIKLQYKKTEQTHIAIGVRSFPIKDNRDPALSVLATVLGRGMSSRLFTKLRDEMGVCYYVRAESDAYTDSGLFDITAGVDGERIDEVIKIILAELKKITTEIIPDSELEKVKNFINGTTMLGLETSDSQAEFVVFQEILRGEIKSPEDFAKEINAVTAKDVQKVAKEIFRDEGLNLAIVGKFKDPEHFRPFFTFNK